jgi:hypothetical protein
MCNNQRSSKFHARGTTVDFSVKEYPNNNFSTSGLISTNQIPIKSAQQMETQGNINKFFKIHFRGATGVFPQNIPA